MNAHGAAQLALQAYLRGDARVEAAEFERMRSEIARTGRPDLMAKAELLRCAGRVASLEIQPCAAFERLRPDADAAGRAYADYLSGRLQPADAALLPEQQRAVAQSLANADAGAAALKAIGDPLARLVAAGVLFQAAQAGAAVQAQAIDTASSQGWRRPLLAWLNVRLRSAEAAQESDEVARVRRRIALVLGEGAVAKP